MAQNCTTAVCVVTAQNDNNRDSYNGNETVLTPSNVNTMSTTPSFQLNVDTGNLPTGGDLPANAASNPISAQPLYVSSVNLGGTQGTHNLLIVATLNGTVFAFDADNNSCNAGSTNVCWSRQGLNGTTGTNALWNDDCGGTAGPPLISGANLPFAGIVSTPVIDVNLSAPSVFLTSFCKPNLSAVQWWIHRLSLLTGADVVTPVQVASPMNAPAGNNSADLLVSGAISFQAPYQNQRPALLEIPNPSGSGNSLIYSAFGTLTNEDSPLTTYHGWVFAYDTSLTQQVAFTTTAAGCGMGGGSTQCSLAGTGAPACDCKVESSFAAAPNWGGHGGGIWMSTRGLAASKLSDGNYHVFYGVGNGGFRNFQSGQPNNFGASILDMRFKSTGPESSPFQSFTPYSSSVLQPSFSGACAGGTNCAYSYQNLNAVDYDMSTSGVLLFNDSAGNPRLVTLDKGGYGYVLTQGNLCGPGVSNCSLQSASPVQAFGSGDNGNIFPFAPVYDASAGGTVLCNSTDHPDHCHRITSLAMFTASSGTKYFYLWPYLETLTSLVVSDGSTQQTGPSTISGSGTTVTLTSCSSPNCFNNLLIAGDKIAPSGSSTQTVVAVVDSTHVTVTPGFSTASPVSWTYSGFFINPAQDVNPPATKVGYAGGAISISANAGQYGVLWSILGQQGSLLTGDTTTRPQANLLAYNPIPIASGSNAGKLGGLYVSSSGFCATPFAIPTIAKGRVYVPTYAISTSSPCPLTGSTSSPSGVLVYAP